MCIDRIEAVLDELTHIAELVHTLPVTPVTCGIAYSLRFISDVLENLVESAEQNLGLRIQQTGTVEVTVV